MAARARPRSPRLRERADAPANAYTRIYAVVRRIPTGRVATYGQVGDQGGGPHAPRVAGYALRALPPGSPHPWHRVVAAGGKLSLTRLSPESGLTQRLRLAAEGVTFDARGCVRMDEHQWRPRAAAPRRKS